MGDMSLPHILQFRAILVPIGVVAAAACFPAPVFGLALLLLVILFGMLSMWRPAWIEPVIFYFSNEIEFGAAWVLNVLLRIAFLIVTVWELAFARSRDRRWRRPDRTAATYWKMR